LNFEIIIPTPVSDIVVARRCCKEKALLNPDVLLEQAVRKRLTFDTRSFVGLIKDRDVEGR
jgi:hypothetical protein